MLPFVQFFVPDYQLDSIHISYFVHIKATLSQLHRETRRVIRPVIHGGEEVVLTDFGKPVARIVPYMPTVTVPPSEARASGTLDDESILTGIVEAREDETQRLDP